MKTALNLLSLLFLISFLTTCTHVISKELREQVDGEIGFRELSQDPTLYRGKTVLFGGEIIGVKNTKDGTLIEILQKPTNTEGRPKDTDFSEGRFLAFSDKYIDSAIYAKGRELTVAGVVKGEKVLPIDETEYMYPVIEIKEMHLWPKRLEEKRYYPDPYYHDPWWWYYPYPGPAIIIRRGKDG